MFPGYLGSAVGFKDDIGDALLARLSKVQLPIKTALLAVSIYGVYFNGGLGIIHWSEAGIMMVASTMLGYAGAHVAKALPNHIIRGFIIAVGLIMSAVFFLR